MNPCLWSIKISLRSFGGVNYWLHSVADSKLKWRGSLWDSSFLLPLHLAPSWLPTCWVRPYCHLMNPCMLTIRFLSHRNASINCGRADLLLSYKRQIVPFGQHLFHLDSTSFHSLNQAYIILLPKKENALEMKDFRPISLIHSFAKIFSKLLASGLAPRLNELVALNQSAFVKGRCIRIIFYLYSNLLGCYIRKRNKLSF